MIRNLRFKIEQCLSRPAYRHPMEFHRVTETWTSFCGLFQFFVKPVANRGSPYGI